MLLYGKRFYISDAYSLLNSPGDAGSSTAVSTTQSQSVDESTSHQTDNVNPESNSNFIFGQSSFDPGVHVDKSQEIVTSSNEQKSLHIIIKGEMARLCQILKVSVPSLISLIYDH